MSTIVLKSGSINIREPSGPVQACNRICFTFYILPVLHLVSDIFRVSAIVILQHLPYHADTLPTSFQSIIIESDSPGTVNEVVSSYCISLQCCMSRIQRNRYSEFDFNRTDSTSRVSQQPYCYKNPASSMILNTLRGIRSRAGEYRKSQQETIITRTPSCRFFTCLAAVGLATGELSGRR